ncbi:GNAT family N-acetyltransferase [Prosthecomicrobium sp. N25]|uniref:GNAT family N-acetyltransferase n=1 Tax=Prosthecomicrobium sp. N25 TaxID=3129254 RepID=UPI00307799E6
MDPSLTLREILPFGTGHMPEIVDLWVETWSKTLPAIDFEARRGWFVDHLVAARDDGQAIRVAFTQTGDAAGFLMIDPATGYLDQIAVGSRWWGKGIAEALLEEARRLCPDRIELDVNQDNPRAVAFYRRNGFVEIGEGVNPRSGLATLKLEWRASMPAALKA